MANKHRDDFSAKTVLQIAKRAGWLCSFPTCRTPTVGATSDGKGEINIGTAAHICAAAPGGPRYDSDMSPEERSSASNGIWMCRDHGKAIDSPDPQFTVDLLREWKRQAEKDSWRRVLRNQATPKPAVAPNSDMLVRFTAAAEADLAVFQRTAKWPSTSVSLTLKVEGLSESIATSALAAAVPSLEDLIIVAPPGMGKTTTLFQIAQGVLSHGNGTPLIVPLGDWATEGATVLGSILKRPAFRGISEDDFRDAAAHLGVVLLLDGWNELDAKARRHARIQIDNLKAEVPELGLVVSTRKQALDVPFRGTRVDIIPLDTEQQTQIAVAVRGDAGTESLYQAWRTAGVRELVTIPLYLTALLSLPEEALFPTTKEEVLRHFVGAHEAEASRAEALHAVTRGFHQDYLDGLALFAIRAAHTSIAESDARRSISDTATLLEANKQISGKPQPDDVLDVLVSSHVLMRAGDAPGYSFQHQQFQEWYASHSVERRILADVHNPGGRKLLKAEVFDLPSWEEPILFAVERMARGNADQRAACGKAIVAAFKVDPILAAEMIYRSTDQVWTQISAAIKSFIARWHKPGEVDRAFRFMLTSGRPEFLDAVWPLISSQDEQISLTALRNCKGFRPSILGRDAENLIKALPQRRRRVVLSEMAWRSGMDGLDLASAIAADDDDPDVQASVVDALAFRGADRHVASILRTASEKTFDLAIRKGLVDQIDEENVKKGVAAARKRQAEQEASAWDRLRGILSAQDGGDRSTELTELVSTMEIDKGKEYGVHLLYEAYRSYPKAVSAGLRARVLAGRTLFYGADDMLAAAGFRLEDDSLLRLALGETPIHDHRANAAASMLGPGAVGQMIDVLLDTATKVRDASGRHNQAASDRYHGLRARLAHVPGASLVAAVQARSAHADNTQMARLAELLSRHPDGDSPDSRPFDAEGLASIRSLAEEWGSRMLESGNAERWHLAEIALMVSHAPDVHSLPLLKMLLDENLRRYRAFRAEAEATAWRGGNAVHEAQQPMTHEYQRAFLAIDAPETSALMREYLTDPHFGELAASVLVSQWIAANELQTNTIPFRGVDFSRVREKRAARAHNPTATCAAAEAIFSAIEPLIEDSATDEQKRLGAALGRVAVRLPHGQRAPTIERIVSLTPRKGRAKLLLNLVLSGVGIDVDWVAEGLAETLQAAKTEPWILTQSESYQLREWLQLLPFTNHPAQALDVIRTIPDAQRQPRLLEELIAGLVETPSEGGEEVLFKLAEDDPRLYRERMWVTSALKLGTASSAFRLVDLAVRGTILDRTVYGWEWAREFGGLIARFSEVRKHVYGLLKDGVTSPQLALLAQAVSENPDTEGLLLLVDIESKQNKSMLGWRTVESVVTEHVPIDGWGGAYNVVPAPAIELRQKLLAMTTDGGPQDAASRCLRSIDALRDEHGLPMSEPRHPDLSSGKPWPILMAESHVTAQ